MSQYLPTEGFRWLTSTEIEELDIANLSDTSEDGYIFEVDLTYSAECHQQHNDYPLAPENINITSEMCSPIQNEYPKHKKVPCRKLAPNLFDKKRYTVHYRNLKYYIETGRKIEKIHRVLSFKQSPWLQSYIQFNTECRKNATSNFEKDFFKLLNNAVFGMYQLK